MSQLTLNVTNKNTSVRSTINELNHWHLIIKLFDWIKSYARSIKSIGSTVIVRLIPQFNKCVCYRVKHYCIYYVIYKTRISQRVPSHTVYISQPNSVTEDASYYRHPTRSPSIDRWFKRLQEIWSITPRDQYWATE